MELILPGKEQMPRDWEHSTADRDNLQITHTHTHTRSVKIYVKYVNAKLHMYMLLTMRSEEVWLPLHQNPLRQMNQTHLSSFPQSTMHINVMTPRKKPRH